MRGLRFNRGISMTDSKPIPIAIPGVSHHTAKVHALEAFRFGDESAFLQQVKDGPRGSAPPDL